MRNALATFQRAIDVIYATNHWQVSLVYFDNIVIFLRSPETYIKHVRHILILFRDTGVTLTLGQYRVCSNPINYFCSVTHLGQLLVSQHTIYTIHDFKPSTSIMELRSFMGLCNVLWRPVSNFERIAALLKDDREKIKRFTFKSLPKKLLALQTCNTTIVALSWD